MYCANCLKRNIDRMIENSLEVYQNVVEFRSSAIMNYDP